MERCRTALLFAFILLGCLLFAQTNGTPAPATITFTLDFPHSTPDHYTVTVDSSGSATYVSGVVKAAPHDDSGSDTVADSDQPYRYTFTVSPATRGRIFDLAARADYFSKDVNYTRHNIANTGEKRLTYKDAQRSTEAKYNYTSNSNVQQLTTLFQSLSATLEYGRRLEEAYQLQKLALDDQLKSMEQTADQNGLLDIQAVAPILRKIAGNSSVMNVSRARAERLLAKAGNTGKSQ
jgi:hypothetical protein